MFKKFQYSVVKQAYFDTLLECESAGVIDIPAWQKLRFMMRELVKSNRVTEKFLMITWWKLLGGTKNLLLNRHYYHNSA